MTNIENILIEIQEINPEAVLLDGLEKAIIGITRNGVVVYSIDRIVDILMTRDGMDADGAIEFFDYNIGCLGLGEFTPIFVEEIKI
tara:strand:- start:9199 stop:9456 length:258 start_codon:yes stop_codon:yes gene_type:complete